ncbi:hypothetical protein ACWD3D_27675, partial [Streptomyces sp. NPDC002690]
GAVGVPAGVTADGATARDGAPRALWSASLFPADLGFPASGPGRIPSGLGRRLTGTGLPDPGAHPPGSAAYLPSRGRTG